MLSSALLIVTWSSVDVTLVADMIGVAQRTCSVSVGMAFQISSVECKSHSSVLSYISCSTKVSTCLKGLLTSREVTGRIMFSANSLFEGLFDIISVVLCGLIVNGTIEL